MENLQPYIDTIVQALVGLLVSFLLGVLAMLRGKVQEWLETRTTVQQRDILHRLAGEAAALAEATYKDAGGPEKMNAAFAYVLQRAAVIGISVERESVQAAIEKAVMDYNTKVKGEANDRS
ncbi:hypothetical protein B1748_29210 [Paenibacillus sp. MY03]|uniref:phage holin, LLH family n=1 Tax=Paenibacillus sp. MY03 TaxID=302980 RepID=UPI000B3C673E|nr:phage holin, LLH family [Paenibacillus sp. MY03]OUS70316.1 hypothetical protein B1748_29210 [Paenibacillus sp. MY03]